MLDLENKRKLLALILVGILVLMGVQQILPERQTTVVVDANRAETPEDSFSQPEIIANEIVVHIAGAVKNAGVYTLPEGARVEDVLQKAGIAENADADALNRAALLHDGQKIVVPFIAESIAESHGTHSETEIEPVRNTAIMSQPNETKQINLNTANLIQLMTLPGIGEVKANAIIRYRQEHGGFQTIDEVLMVNGIGAGIYAQIAELIYV